MRQRRRKDDAESLLEHGLPRVNGDLVPSDDTMYILSKANLFTLTMFQCVGLSDW